MPLRTTTHRFVTVALAVTVSVAALGACGSSDDSTAKTTTTAAAEATTTTAVTATSAAADVSSEASGTCDAWLDVERVASEGPGGGEGPPSPEQIVAFAEKLQPLIATVADGAPNEIADAIGDVKQIIDAAAADTTGVAGQKLDPSNPALGTPLAKVEEWAYGNCGFTQIDVMGKDYSFDGVPTSVKAGPASLKFTNMSDTETHEMALIRVGNGVSAEELADALKKDTNAAQQTYGSKVTFVSETSAEPGKTGYTIADLSSGDYVIACFIPQGGKDGGTPHSQLGMVSTLRVE